MNEDVYDLLVLGSGIAGLVSAAAAAEAGLSVAVISKEDDPLECTTWYAQGGIVETGHGDSTASLVADILAAGSAINNINAVRLVAEEGPSLVREYLIEKAAVPFSRTVDGGYDYTREGAHSLRRILYVKDHSGRSIEEALMGYARSLKNLRLFSGLSAIDLITNCHNSLDSQERYRPARVLGAYVLDNKNGSIKPFFASAVVVACGGIGNLFLHTSNPRGATGDGVAMAYRAGCEIINAEYVQFHPTILFHRDVKRFLITEAVRGEGARLVNRRGEYFMDRYNHELLDLSPRDEVARAIYAEMYREGSEYVYLDATRISTVALDERFPSIYRVCLDIGVDISRDMIPVVPAAHYFCGGIKTDLNGATSIQGLYAVGENACSGIHGANRLASVSLLEALTFGVRAGRAAASAAAGPPLDIMKTVPDWVYPNCEEQFDEVLISNDLHYIQSIMWNYVGIVRTRKRLQRAMADLNYLSHRVESFYREAKVTRTIVELRNAIVSANLITKAAASNRRSIGCHYLES